MSKNYYSFFERGKRTSKDWENPIGRPRLEDSKSGKFGQLHHDVFNHHHQPESVPHYVKNLVVQQYDASRIISVDNLTDYYLNSDLPVETILIEKDYIDEDDYESLESFECSFAEFFSAVTDIPFDPRNVNYNSLGGNRVRYLLGSVGSGKSFLCARLIAKLQCNPIDVHGFYVVPVAINFEALFKSNIFQDNTVIGKTFYLNLLGDIERRMKKIERVDLPAFEVPPNATDQQVFNMISDYVLKLARNKIRLVVIFDNIDAFHYKYSRYTFFPNLYDKFLETINVSIVSLCSVMGGESFLGNIGLCVLIVMRENVAKDVAPNLADTEAAIFDGFRAFWVKEPDHKEIIESRYKLLDAASHAIVDAGISLSGDRASDYLDKLKVAKERILSNASNSAEGLGVIWGLCHHGHRSLIDFISKIKINYYIHPELHERMFGANPHTLERLYITNMKRRYAQSMNHFPNVFLCDAWVNKENYTKDVQCSHHHTYWLKYMMLKYLLVKYKQSKNVDGQEIIEFFVNKVGFESRLVRLCLGSLCMANESRCIEIIGLRDTAPEERPLKLTTRGKVLVDDQYIEKKGIAYCFDISYLQLITDDFWLALPKEFADGVVVDTNLAYTFELGDRYRKGVSRYLSLKIYAAIKFLRILEAAWKYEELKCKGGPEAIRFLKPNFNNLFKNLCDTAGAIIDKGFGGIIISDGRSISKSDINSYSNQVRSEKRYDEFFEELWRSRCQVNGVNPSEVSNG